MYKKKKVARRKHRKTKERKMRKKRAGIAAAKGKKSGAKSEKA